MAISFQTAGYAKSVEKGQSHSNQKEQNEDQKEQPNNPKKNEDEHLCFICANKSEYWAVGPCGHPYCAVCALRLRSILKTKCCPMCKSVHDSIFIGTGCTVTYCSNTNTTTHQSKELGIGFESERCRHQVLGWLEVKCPICNQNNFKRPIELEAHITDKHKKFMCRVCLEHKPVFSFEQVIYPSHTALLSHIHSSAGHPKCPVCPSSGNALFYSDDELQIHCRDKHEQCHLCVKQIMTRSMEMKHYPVMRKLLQDTVHLDYANLQRHFEQQHFACTDPVCLEMRFVVFGSEIELKAHQHQVHSSNQRMQRSQQRLAARISFGDSSSAVTLGSARSTERNHRNTHGDAHENEGNGANNQSSGNRESIRRETASRGNGETNRRTAARHPSINQSSQSNQTTTHQPTQKSRIDSWFMFVPLDNLPQVSWSSLETMNKDFTKYLADIGKQDKLALLRERTKAFQNNSLTARDLVSFIHVDCKLDVKALARHFDQMLSAMDLKLKQAELAKAVTDHENLQAAFPSLPHRNTVTSSSSQNYRQEQKGKEPVFFKARLVTKPGNVSRPGNPARNPGVLVGNKPFSNGSVPRALSPPIECIEQEFPKLAISNTHDSDDDAVFTIGQQQQVDTQDEPNNPQQERGKKAKKVLLRRFGGFSNPI